MVRGPDLQVLAPCLAAILLLSPISMAAERINLLLLLENCRIDGMKRFFDPEPSVCYTVVVTYGSFTDPELLKLIRLYFPRTYEQLSQYDVLLLARPSYWLFTTKQDKWIHDSILEGAGGINDGSVFSQVSGVPEAWCAGVAWQAFPNDAPEVTAHHAAWAPVQSYAVEVNKDHPEPIVTIFVPFGVERFSYGGVSRVVLPRDGSSVLAWQVGNYATKQPLLASWEYGSGRAMTVGNLIPGGWLGYPTGVTGENPYSAEILINILFWLADTGLIQDVEVFHRVKTDFTEFMERMKVLLSLSDFIDKFGANTKRIQDEMMALEQIYAEAAGEYLEHSFADSEVRIRSALSRLPEVEQLATREKDKALIWVYLIEWLVSASALFVSGFILWTLMVRRKLYHAVRMTKLRVADG